MKELGGFLSDTQVAVFVCLWSRHSQFLRPWVSSCIKRACSAEIDRDSSEGLEVTLTPQGLTALACLSCLRQAAKSLL